MMRKLSVASITSSFTKRSASLASVHKASLDEAAVAGDDRSRLPRHELKRSNTSAYEAEDGGSLKLPIIEDEQERKSSGGSPPTAVFQVAHVTGSVRTLRTPSEDAVNDGPVLELPALKSSSTNSLRLTPKKARSSKLSLAGSEKENLCHAPKMHNKGMSRGSTRWTKVGVLNKDVMVRGIRSFFR
jgi:hypothetical protein